MDSESVTKKTKYDEDLDTRREKHDSEKKKRFETVCTPAPCPSDTDMESIISEIHQAIAEQGTGNRLRFTCYSSRKGGDSVDICYFGFNKCLALFRTWADDIQSAANDESFSYTERDMIYLHVIKEAGRFFDRLCLVYNEKHEASRACVTDTGFEVFY
jgi:hypothetical protein